MGDVRASLIVVTLFVACSPKPAGPRACPEENGPNCYLFSPADSDLSGQGAAVDHIAVRPSDTSRGQLLVFLNGSGGAPSNGADVLRVGRELGLHAIALSYRSDVPVGVMCRGEDGCFEPSRVSLLTGELQEGAAEQLSNLQLGEGIEPRLVAALKLLGELDADGGWAQFLTGDAVRWSRVLASGHSQGGGHAALIAKRYAVVRVLMLASPCDARDDGSPTMWLSSSAGWATPPSKLFGLWAEGDDTCPVAPAIWSALNIGGPDTSGACAGRTNHGAPLTCPDNFEKWKVVFGAAP